MTATLARHSIRLALHPGDSAWSRHRIRWAEVAPLFEAALDLPLEERDAFLVRACGGDDELLRSVRRLLARADSTADRFEQPGPSLLRAALGGPATRARTRSPAEGA